MKKRIFRMFVVTLSLVVLCGSFQAFASASPTKFTFNFSNSNGASTAAREKENSSSMYIYMQSGEQIQVFSYGCHSPSGQKNDADCALDRIYIIPGKAYSIRNYVWEKGFTYGGISARNYNNKLTCTGNWSPDSY
jgi:hypothetical protein